jgi:hypothetical protein
MRKKKVLLPNLSALTRSLQAWEPSRSVVLLTHRIFVPFPRDSDNLGRNTARDDENSFSLTCNALAASCSEPHARTEHEQGSEKQPGIQMPNHFVVVKPNPHFQSLSIWDADFVLFDGFEVLRS